MSALLNRLNLRKAFGYLGVVVDPEEFPEQIDMESEDVLDALFDKGYLFLPVKHSEGIHTEGPFYGIAVIEPKGKDEIVCLPIDHRFHTPEGALAFVSKMARDFGVERGRDEHGRMTLKGNLIGIIIRASAADDTEIVQH